MVLVLAGQIAGMVMRIPVADFEAAAASPGLYPHNQALMDAVLRFRQELEHIVKPPSPPFKPGFSE